MAIRRTKSGRYKASNGRTYAKRKSAVRAERQSRKGTSASRRRKAKHRRVMKGRRKRRR